MQNFNYYLDKYMYTYTHSKHGEMKLQPVNFTQLYTEHDMNIIICLVPMCFFTVCLAFGTYSELREICFICVRRVYVVVVHNLYFNLNKHISKTYNYVLHAQIYVDSEWKYNGIQKHMEFLPECVTSMRHKLHVIWKESRSQATVWLCHWKSAAAQLIARLFC